MTLWGVGNDRPLVKKVYAWRNKRKIREGKIGKQVRRLLRENIYVGPEGILLFI